MKIYEYGIEIAGCVPVNCLRTDDGQYGAFGGRFVSLEDHRAAVTMAGEAERQARADHLAEHASKAAASGCYEVSELLLKIAGEFSPPYHEEAEEKH